MTLLIIHLSPYVISLPNYVKKNAIKNHPSNYGKSLKDLMGTSSNNYIFINS